MPGPTLRLFFALPCPPMLAGALCHWRDRLGVPGRPVACANLHLTLAFLGAQPQERLATLLEVGATMRAPAFSLSLNHLHTTRRGLMWIEPDAPPKALHDLAASLRAALAAAQVAFDTQPFRPHVTLIREGASVRASEAPAFDWTADRLALFASENTPQGVHYRVLGEWRLDS